MPNYYPLMLDVRGRSAIVIGGDRVAAEKAAALSASGAQVTVINTDFCADLLEMASQQRITLRYKAYEHGDLAGAFIVVAAATYNRPLAEAIWQEGQEHGQLVNIVDVPALCNFIVPSIMRRGPLTISVSTEGTSPALAKRIRQRLETLFPAEYALYLRIATIVRRYMKVSGLSYAQRDTFFGDFFVSEVLDLLIAGDEAAALDVTVQLLRRHNVDIPVATLVKDMEGAEAHDKNTPIA